MSGPTSVHTPISNTTSASETPSSSRRAPAPNNAAGSSSTASSSFLSPSFQSSSSRLQPSASASASRSTPTATTSNATASAATGAHPRVTMDLNPTLPSRATQIHIDEARAALVASMSNMLDSELQSRASLLHANAAALTKQEKDVVRGTEGLRRENDKLEKLARDTERKIKELGNVQNWAEVLERDFLVLEETMRLVKGGSRSGSDDETCSECSRSTWSGSYSADGDSRVGSRRGSMNGGTDSGVKKSDATNGKFTVDGTTGGDPRKARSDTKVTVDEAVAANISEAMAMDLHDAFEPLTLEADPVPSSTQSSTSKGKEPATDEISDIDASEAELSKPVQSYDTSEHKDINKDSTSKTTE